MLVLKPRFLALSSSQAFERPPMDLAPAVGPGCRGISEAALNMMRSSQDEILLVLLFCCHRLQTLRNDRRMSAITGFAKSNLARLYNTMLSPGLLNVLRERNASVDIQVVATAVAGTVDGCKGCVVDVTLLCSCVGLAQLRVQTAGLCAETCYKQKQCRACLAVGGRHINYCS